MACAARSPDVAWGFLLRRRFGGVVAGCILMAHVDVVHRVVFVEYYRSPKHEVRAYSIETGELLGTEALVPDFQIRGVTPNGTLLVANKEGCVLEISGGATPTVPTEVPMTAQLRGRHLLSLTCCALSGKIATFTTDTNLASPTTLQLFGADKCSLLWQRAVSERYRYNNMHFLHGGAELACVMNIIDTSVHIRVQIRCMVNGTVLRTFSFSHYYFAWGTLVPCDGDTAVLARDSVNYTVVKLSLRDGTELERYSNFKREWWCGCLGGSTTTVLAWSSYGGVCILTSLTLRRTWIRCVAMSWHAAVTAAHH